MLYNLALPSSHAPLRCFPADHLPPGWQVVHGPAKISSLPEPGQQQPEHPPPEKLLLHPHYSELQHFLSGRELLLEEINLAPSLLTPFIESGFVKIRSGLEQTLKGYVCRRCGEDSPRRFGIFPCACCQTSCTYCRSCLMMGKISSCTALYSWNGPSPPQPISHNLAWDGVFSEGQKRAADKINSAISRKEELLIWAVCGAGKTEIVFPAVRQALQAGKRILLATPRTDVVLELVPRFQLAFPDTLIAGLYGGSEDRHRCAPLTIATTHQTMRFREAFDVVIIDEVDAFPYTYDASLQYAVEKAKKHTAATIYLTATPTKALKRRISRRSLHAVRIPRRYHGYPLPVPRFQWTGKWKKHLEKKRLPDPVLSWCRERIASKTPAFLFVPSVHVLEEVTILLQSLDAAVEGVHAEDANRHEKVNRFREKSTPLLVTTTILERGVTIPGVDVAVLGAEAEVFEESALVQIAGRAGRSKDEPEGDVVFFHFGKTNAMVHARNHILEMNREGAET
ncbi:DEAD/DEAH box helicase [Alteribacillus sp. HJP-4]|uniref:DEAD/DEAH box helicase n=1 Tax=Alteribacillus sp. HJP-4 TaxID=2775394 RepID=UPI0035CCE05F